MTIIRQNVTIEDRLLDSNYEQSILNKMRKVYEKTCTKKNGYIVSIDNIEEIHSNSISSADSMVVFDVSFNATTMKPEIGDEISGKVCMVEMYGIFIRVHEKLKILVPTLSLTENKYMYDEHEEIFKIPQPVVKSKSKKKPVLSNEKKRIEVGTDITVELTNVRYEKKQYDCIGKFSRTT